MSFSSFGRYSAKSIDMQPSQCILLYYDATLSMGNDMKVSPLKGETSKIQKGR